MKKLSVMVAFSRPGSGRITHAQTAAGFLQMIIISALTLIFMAGIPVNTSAQNWYNTNWSYRKSHLITGSAGAGTNYQVRILVHIGIGTDSGPDVYLGGTGFQSGASDVRFTAADGTTELHYWIEEISVGLLDSYAAIWVEVSGDLGSDQTIYIYWGNSAATTTTSNGDSTFILFDDFDGTSLNAAKWTRIGGNTPTFPNPPSGGMITTGNGTKPSKIIATGIPEQSYRSIVARMMLSFVPEISGTEHVGVGTRTSTSDGKGYNFVLRDPDYWGKKFQFYNDAGTGTWGSIADSGWMQGNYYILEAMDGAANGIRGRYNYGDWHTQSWSGGTGKYSLNIGSENAKTYWDWAFIRKCILPEPVQSDWGALQTFYTWNNSVSNDWTVAANWTPARKSPATGDGLAFKGNGSVTLINVPTQTIAGLFLYDNITVNLQANPATVQQLTVTDFVSTTSGDVLNFGPALVLNGTFTANASNGTIQTGVLTASSPVPLPPGKTWGGTVQYNSTGGAQTIVQGTYNNLTVSGDNSKTLSGNISLTGNLNMQSSTLSNGGFAITGSAGKTCTLANGVTLVLTGNSAFPSGFGTTTLGSASMVNYTGADQPVAAQAYGNLALSGSGAKTAAGAFTVNGSTAISGATFKSGTTAGYSASMGILSMGSNSTIALGTGSHTLTFAGSSAASWTGNLIITGWQGGWNGTSGTAGKIFFGTGLNGLTATQLEHLWFYDGASYWPAIFLLTGEVVPKVLIAKVNTISIGNITPSTATVLGEVTDDRGHLVTAKGIVWSTASNPTIGTHTGMTNNGNGLGSFSGDLTGLTTGQTWYARAYATNSLGTAYGQEISFATGVTLPTVTTAAIINITGTTVLGGGTVTLDGGAQVTARGVCWNVDHNPTIDNSHTSDGTGTGIFTSSITGLAAGQTYYVRSYATNNAGTVYGNEVSFATPGFTCGTSTITVQHTSAGGVAPENKTVTYSTVTNIPGETLKCWITQNLGAGRPASAVSDASERSAGWYWQFNRKQGYKHTGTTRTPNSTWITSINENPDWQAANDPCTLSLGTGWHIPTNTEWTNVDAAGTWTDWNGPWNSGLKLHAAGYLNLSDGSLVNRGSQGSYWSSAGNGFTEANDLNFNSGLSNMMSSNKAYGFTLRCMRPGLPVVSTSAASTITTTTALSGGNVTDEGFASVTQRGVCWSTSQSPTVTDNHTTDGTGAGVFTSSITGLAPGQSYFVRAYAASSEGIAYGNEVRFTTALDACGGSSTITVSHIAGNVAPVTKTVTYGTVTNIPGETSKCWITKNLGADHQGTAVSDNTELSAGWYWQFNRPQGYKHDGTTRTPNSTWITSISESSDWITGNDPCALEFGNGWRIPTKTEWTNVDATAGGNWTDWNGPWNSRLKLHVAGRLNNSTGSLLERGNRGYYSSSTQFSNPEGYDLEFRSSECVTGHQSKSFAFPVRCIREAFPIGTSANFKADTICGGAPLTVHFTDLSVTSQSPLTWKWYFGDGDSSSVQNPVHTYHLTGSDMNAYTVTLKVIDAGSNTSTLIKTDYIKVTPSNYIDGGNVSGVWTKAASPYFIGGEIIVPAGQTLTLQPGTILKFRTNSTDWTEMTDSPTRENTDFGFMTVYGTLIAQGTAADSIVFTRMGSHGSWGLIHMTKNASIANPIRYCKMEYASFMDGSENLLTQKGWNYQSTPFTGTNVLSTSPDMAQFIKDFVVDDYLQATLSLGFDDGCRVWLNGTMILDYHLENHTLSRWNHAVDISGMLQKGRNRLAVEVYNGVYGGSGTGGFDCQLMVDGVAVIKRGDQNNGQPQAIWYYYGQVGQQLIPPRDPNGLDWFEKNYAIGGNALAGLSLDGNGVTVSNSRFCNNVIAILCDSSNAVVRNNNISSNRSGIIINHLSPLIEYNVISSNSSGIGCYQQSSPQIKHNIISSNMPDGIDAFSGASFTATSNTLADNGYGLYCENTGSIKIDNSILWNNSKGNVNSDAPAITWSCVQGGHAGTGNISGDPKFLGTPGHQYDLTWSNFPAITNPDSISPCINTGNLNLNGTGGNWTTDTLDRDPDMSRPDMGARYFHQLPVVAFYNAAHPDPADDEHKFFDFLIVDVNSPSNPKTFSVRNDAQRYIDCRVSFKATAGNQFHLLFPADTLLHLAPNVAASSVKVVFQPTTEGAHEDSIFAGVPGQYRDWVRVYGKGAGSGNVTGNVTTHPPNSVGVVGVTITLAGGNNNASFTTTTGPGGHYSLTNIGYGDFTVTPTFPNHSFAPPSAFVTVTENTDGAADFYDDSYFSVSGNISYLNTNACPSSGRKMLMDGAQLYPVVTTDITGHYEIPNVPVGTHIFKPDTTGGHRFEPSSATETILLSSVSGVNFADKFTHNLSGYVTGGCGIPLANSIQLVVHCNNSCIPADITIHTDATGYYTVNLPPNQYTVRPTDFVYHSDPLVQFPTIQANLQNRDTIVNFIYHRAPVVEITGFDTLTTTHGWIILEQFKQYRIGIDVYEPYFGPSGDTIMCRANSGKITILDDVGDAGQDTASVSSTTTFYSFHAGYPNITGGGQNPYQKRLQVQYVNGATNAETTKWIYVVGQRPRATAYTTTTPEIPLLILRDPPGDNSYCYLSETTQFSQAIGFSMKHGTGGGAYEKLSLGADFEFEEGFLFSVSTNIDVTLDFTAGIDISMSQNSVEENQMTFITNNQYNTSQGDQVVGRKADLYMGGAMNVLYGITDILSIKDEVVTLSKDIILVPKGFATTYIYSEDYIENVIIPSLYLIRDETSAHRWESFIELNQSLKDGAASTVPPTNISFAGVNPSHSETLEKSSTHTEEFELLIDKQVAVDAGLTINGIGFGAGFYVSTSYSTGESKVKTTVNTTEIGYNLSDDDPLDGFSVEIKRDRVYGTPVFETKSGQSSCPYEKHTVPRQGCRLSPKTFVANGVPPAESAEFIISLENTSQTDETWDYTLSLLNSTNPHGAAVSIGGAPSGTPVTYTVDAENSTTATIRISKPAGEYYDLTGIKLMLTSPCQSDSGFSDTATFDVHFIPPCSRVSVPLPGNNWVVNQASNHQLPVTFTDYDLANTQLTAIALEYSANQGNTWTEAFTIPKASLPPTLMVHNWDVGGYDDGDYQFRAVAKCGNANNYSDPHTGHIDVHPPQVFGNPEPADGVLIAGDEISYTFSEALDPATVTINTCKLINVETGLQVGATVQYNATVHKIIFTINAGLGYFIENKYLKSQVAGVTDRYGNPLADTASRTFYVDQGPLHWTPNSFPFQVSQNQTPVFNFISTLSNNSPNQVYYSLITPNSIDTASSMNGYLSAAGGQVDVTFTTQTRTAGNAEYDTIFATALGFPPEKIYLSFYTPGYITMDVAPAGRNVSSATGTTTFSVTSNLAWSVKSNATWLSAAPSYGYDNQTITANFDENTSGIERTGTITITPEGVPLTPVTVSVIQAGDFPSTLLVSGVTVQNSEAECYKALQTITAQNFTVENGGVVHMIAGNKIDLVPSVHAKSGSAFHAWISATDMCGSMRQPLIAVKEEHELPAEAANQFSGQDKFFRVYPNPTTGEFTLELMNSEEPSNITVNIFGMQGNKIKSTELTARRQYTFNISDSKPGIYLIQVIENDKTGVMRVVKQ